MLTMCKMETSKTRDPDLFSDTDKDDWAVKTAAAIQQIEQHCNAAGAASGNHRLVTPPSTMPAQRPTRLFVQPPPPPTLKKDRPKSDSCVDEDEDHGRQLVHSRRTVSEKFTDGAVGGGNSNGGGKHILRNSLQPRRHLWVSTRRRKYSGSGSEGGEDFRFIDESARSSFSTAPMDPSSASVSSGSSFATAPEEPTGSRRSVGTSTSPIEEKSPLATAAPSVQSKATQVGGSLTDAPIVGRDYSVDQLSEVCACTRAVDSDGQSVYSIYMEKDFRYYFQHPYARLFVSYFVIFCNFLIFAEDPVSHAHTESEIYVVGSVISFIATKYPPQWGWILLKVTLWIVAIITGLVVGKYIIHHIFLSRILRLKMFRDEQGTWMIMFLSALVFVYIFSLGYNILLLYGHPHPRPFLISAHAGLSNANFMKACACGTWLGDFITAWMVTDMMLQDNLYPEWGRPFRNFWKSHGRTRITIFWTGSIVMSALVITLIVSDWISWDYLNRDFVATTELSRAFLASFILVMDLLIVMQDWDFPHFVCDLDIKLPGMHQASFKFKLFRKYVSMPDIVFHITGKWFNYGIIVIVMILDLNMWKNQIFYSPSAYGQYTGPGYKIFTVSDLETLATGNATLWSFEYRSREVDPRTNRTLMEGDLIINSRYLDYPLSVKGMAFIPCILGFVMFGTLTYLYGRFPPKTDATAGGRLKKRRPQSLHGSSWRRERGGHRLLYISWKGRLNILDREQRV